VPFDGRPRKARVIAERWETGRGLREGTHRSA
jgi:hypothetical protein